MQIKKSIQIFDDPSEAHYFLYKGKKFPFNFNIFKISSNYFSNSQEELLNIQNINLIDETSEDFINFSDESIQTFINYSQRQQIILTNENVVSLNYLAHKYEVNKLIKATENFINEYQNDLALQVLLIYQNEHQFNTETYENIISNQFESYINDDQLLSLNFPDLFRIFNKFMQKRDKSSKIKGEISDFLFKCLSKYGREASSLFSLIDVGDMTSEKVNTLLTTFSEIFDFHFINSSILRTIYETQNESLKREEQSRIEIKSLKDEIQRIKDDQKNQFESQKKKEEENINEIKLQFEKFKDEFNQIRELQTKSFNDELLKLRNQLKQKDDEIQRIKDDQKNQFESQQKKEEENINEIKLQFEKLKDEFNQNKELQTKSFNDELDQLKDQLKQKDDENYQIKKILSMNLIDIKLFNTNNTEKQKIIINILKGVENNEKFLKIEQIVNYLSNINKNINSVFILSDSNEISNCDFSKIMISHQMTELLFDLNELKSLDLFSNIDNFSEFFFEIKYPSEKFENIYEQILEIKHSHKNKVQISIFITGMIKTDLHFRNNKEINRVSLDSCVEKIESSENDEGSFEGCSSLEDITIPSTVKIIGPNSFLNCSSLKSIEIPSLEKKMNFSDFEGCKSLNKITTPFITESIPIANIDDYEIEKLVNNDYNTVFKGKNTKTGEKVVIKKLITENFYQKVYSILGAHVSQINLPGILKIKSFRFPLTDEEKTKFKLLKYETNQNGKPVSFDLTGFISISEYMENGNVSDNTVKYLESEGKENDKMNPTIRSKIIFGVASTMKHLHKKKIFHRNLTCKNILLDENLEPKIGSFSLAQPCYEPFHAIKKIGTPLCMAPEMINDSFDEYGLPVDVYAYALIIYRLFNPNVRTLSDGKNYRSKQHYLSEIVSGKRLQRTKNIPDHYWSLIERCWQQDPSKRPTFDEITEILKDDKYALEEFGMKTDLEQLHEYQNRIDKF